VGTDVINATGASATPSAFAPAFAGSPLTRFEIDFTRRPSWSPFIDNIRLDDAPPAVPLPAGLWLVLARAGALGLATRRRA
jgi:hypothetical protein